VHVTLPPHTELPALDEELDIPDHVPSLIDMRLHRDPHLAQQRLNAALACIVAASQWRQLQNMLADFRPLVEAAESLPPRTAEGAALVGKLRAQLDKHLASAAALRVTAEGWAVEEAKLDARLA
jgi:hypothetical protein